MRHIYICILLILLCLRVSGGQDDELDILRSCVLETAKSQVGVKEATGNNDGIQVEIYLRYVGLKKGNAWCAAAQCFILAQHCIDNPHNARAAAFFPDERIVYDRRYAEDSLVVPTDFFGLWINGGIHHVGMIERWGAWVTTYEGNTSDTINVGEATRNGDGFYHKKRMKKQIFQVSRWVQL